MKKSNVTTIVAIGIGAALFFVLGRFVAIPSVALQKKRKVLAKRAKKMGAPGRFIFATIVSKHTKQKERLRGACLPLKRSFCQCFLFP